MISEEEVRDLQILVNLNDKFVNDLCKLSLESLKEEVNPKIFITAANKLNVNPVQIEKVTQALLSFYLKAAEKNLDEREFDETLNQLEHSSEVKKSIKDTYIQHKDFIRENLARLGMKVLEYEDFDWRFDVLTKTRSLSGVTDPVITMQLKLNDEGSETIQQHHMQMDPNTLISITDSLEEAIQQARSHHIHKFKKHKKT